ncbi:ubiquitin C-terminal hydrolase [Meredithblackwellia eburnea MCA 4105]
MSVILVKVKHSGKTYDDVKLDLDQPGLAFKQEVYQLTGVEVAKVKIVVKGGMLKDDADMKKLGFKAVIGAAGPIPQAPTKPIIFMEDMTDQQLAQAVAYPVGLTNLGNTCYMNSTIQVLRAIPELQTALNSYRDSDARSLADASLTSALRDLYADMGKTSEGFPPMLFLSMLRQFAPQFAERSRTSGGYAQQDAQEAWGSIVTAVKQNLNVSAAGQGKFVERFLEGELERTVKSVEAPDEEPVVTKEKFSDIKCNISANTNYMISGITEGFTEQIEKTSPSLGRSAVYTATSRISRLPSYLTVNLVRFFWRREIGKKTKIMRKVKFPFDLDMIDLVTDDLKKSLLPVNEKLKEVDKDRRERAKIRKRAKIVEEARLEEEKKAEKEKSTASTSTAAATAEAEDPPVIAAGSSGEAMAVDGEPEGPKAGELVDEPSKRKEEAELLRSLVSKELAEDVGANFTGMYELVAVVTHKGASADGGHYVGWHRVDRTTTVSEIEDPDKAEWYKFDDDKVSTVTRDKIATLDGGGEDHSAYILLYASKKLE